MYINKDENRHPLPKKGEKGFTLVELLVVMAVFIIVIMIASDCFNKILARSSLLSRSAESNIEGIVGLEMFRHDLNQSGFGLPWGFYNATPPTYSEAEDEGVFKPSLYNDAPNGVPRAVVAGNNLVGGGILDNTDYLALRGTTLSRNSASQRWSYINYSSVGSRPPKQWSSENLVDNDKVIVLRRSFSEAGYVNQLVYKVPTAFYTTFSKDGLATDFSPQIPQDNYYVYGICSDQTPRMPFNRTDYFVKRPATISSSCAQNTGVLYKANVNHSDGKLTEIPILDCVGDMQVVLGWDLNDDGVVDAFSNADGSTVAGGSVASVQAAIVDAEQIRNRLKIVKVYLLVQDGRKDPSFKNTQDIVVGNENLGEVSLTHKYDVAAINSNNWTNYRWKVYRVVVTPKNLALK
jgi:prepilin-type N-terminal cleavage/methylation domain-containing protein